MLRKCSIAAAFLWAVAAFAQDPGDHPPPYRGVNTIVDGVFVTPVPGVPFSAVVKIESTQVLPDGTSATRKSIATIARDSRGRIYNERRQLMPSTFTGTPQILSSHIFDPETRLSTFLNPYTRMARQMTIPQREATASAPEHPFLKQQDLGTETMENFAVHGTSRSRTIPAAASGTAKDLVVTDEYWYSDELHMNMLTRHEDARTGLQVLTITGVNRSEPDPAMFQVPPGYKVVDENPPN